MMWWIWQKTWVDTMAAWIGEPASAAPENTPENALVKADSEAAKYQVLAENGNQILCILNRQQGCVYLSANWQRITGLSPQASLGWALFEHLAVGDTTAAQDLAKGTPAPQSRLQLTHADGTRHWYEFSCCAAHSVTGNEGDTAYLMQNIDNHVRTQDSLQQMHAQLDAALQDRLQFFGSVSHDLRTPLNAIIGFTEIMQAGTFGRVASARYEDYLTHIRSSGYELLARIDHLLAAAEPEAPAPAKSSQDKARVLDFASSA